MTSILLLLMLTVQKPSNELDAVVKRATDYVANYEAQFGNLIGSEEYTQTWTNGRSPKQLRQISSDVLLLQVGGEWSALRKVNRVDGSRVKKPVETFEESFGDSPAENVKRLVQMKTESAEYNLGDIERDINSPTFALKVLRESEVWRFSFERAGSEKINGVQTWVVRFQERGTQTLVRGGHGELLHSTGTLWIEPATGRVMKTEFLIDNPWGQLRVQARTSVTYQPGKTIDLLLPHQMVEHYETLVSKIDCEAEYSNFRRFAVDVKVDFGPPKPR